jgi:N-acetylmuramoyl-L-alanine amidase
MLVLSFKENVIFTEKRYTKNSIIIGFEIVKKRTIVIDAGHGGKDPGTICITKDAEKNVTLVTAIELRNLLLKDGRYRVILTRDRDEFVSIDERLAKIRAANADLLISLHTDSNNDPRMRGIAIYTLPNLDYIKNPENRPQDSREKEQYYKTLIKSRKFADTLAKHIPNICKIKNRPCRNEELKILKTNTPAILLELGRVSNIKDNQLLHLKEFRERICRAILLTIERAEWNK